MQPVIDEWEYESFFFFSSRRRHTRSLRDWSSDVCSSDLSPEAAKRGRFSAVGAGGDVHFELPISPSWSAPPCRLHCSDSNTIAINGTRYCARGQQGRYHARRAPTPGSVGPYPECARSARVGDSFAWAQLCPRVGGPDPEETAVCCRFDAGGHHPDSIRTPCQRGRDGQRRPPGGRSDLAPQGPLPPQPGPPPGPPPGRSLPPSPGRDPHEPDRPPAAPDAPLPPPRQPFPKDHPPAVSPPDVHPPLRGQLVRLQPGRLLRRLPDGRLVHAALGRGQAAQVPRPRCPVLVGRRPARRRKPSGRTHRLQPLAEHRRHVRGVTAPR